MADLVPDRSALPLPAQLAALHASAFDGPARWSQAAFEAALDQGGTLLVTVSDADAGGGFALGRIILDEAELLTIVVPGTRRRHGIGRTLLQHFEARARTRGATMAFLEVSAENRAALALYVGAGWRAVGQRSGYYEGVDALTMRKDL